MWGAPRLPRRPARLSGATIINPAGCAGSTFVEAGRCRRLLRVPTVKARERVRCSRLVGSNGEARRGASKGWNAQPWIASEDALCEPLRVDPRVGPVLWSVSFARALAVNALVASEFRGGGAVAGLPCGGHGSPGGRGSPVRVAWGASCGAAVVTDCTVPQRGLARYS
jgi:hypothetical protein